MSDRQPACGDGQAMAAAGRMAQESGAAADAREAPLREWLAGQGGAWHADVQLFARPGRWEGDAHSGLAARAPLEAGAALLRVPPRAILASAGAADALAACPVSCYRVVTMLPAAILHTASSLQPYMCRRPGGLRRSLLAAAASQHTVALPAADALAPVQMFKDNVPGSAPRWLRQFHGLSW